MGDPLRSLRTRAGFEFDVALLSEEARERFTGVVVGFIGDAIELDELDVLEEWRLEMHPGAYAIELGEDDYLTLSIEREDEERIVYLERAGGSEVLAAPRRE